MQSGHTLLHYRLVDQIGEGGMGVVWRATDTTLDRDVAIKVLPQIFSQDAERLTRFGREAKLLASLNHPNIATVHGLHEAPLPTGEVVKFLAMEMVEGEDLSMRLARGPLAVDEALTVSLQVAAALEAAHSRGVVHRDLKPANVVLAPDGTAKVLDFGLAKTVDPDAASASGSLTLSPTMTSAGTVAGMILGTAAYMSPEQARGKPIDRRTDLWSFGCLMYECLTAVQLFKGETVSDSLAAILRKDPEWSLLPSDTPPLVRLLLRRCLTRKPDKRLQDAGDARLELEQAIEDPRAESLGLVPSVEATPSKAGMPGWLGWAVAVAALAVVAVLALQQAEVPVAELSRKLTIPVPGPTEFGDGAASPPAISRDGRFVSFGITDETGRTRLWLRPTDDFTAQPLDDTDGARYAFWSPDGRHIGYFREAKLRRLEVATGRTQSISAKSSSYPRGGSWNSKDQIIFAPDANSPILLIDAAGGEARPVTTLDPAITDGSHRWPWFLPDDDHFLFVSWTNDLQALEDHGGVYIASLSGGTQERIVADASSVTYADPGYLLVVRDDNLIAIPFDADERRITGEPVVVANGVLRDRASGHGAFSTSMEGTLVYASGQSFHPARLSWYEHDSGRGTDPVEPDPYANVQMSPDARRAAVELPGPSGDAELWIIDLERGVRTRLAYGPASYNAPVWSADGKRLMYNSAEASKTDIYVRSADGSGVAQPAVVTDEDKELHDWSRDGKYVAYYPVGPGSGTSDIWIYSVERQTEEPLLRGISIYDNARFSPDSRYLAYESNESGRLEIFVQALIDEDGIRGGARWQLSTDGGLMPHWRDDGREILYVDPQQRLMAVKIEPRDGDLALSAPREVVSIDGRVMTWDATGDHRRFLIATREHSASEPLRVVLDWPADLKR